MSAGTRCGSMPRVKFEAGVEAVFIVAPGATEVPGLQRLLAQERKALGLIEFA